MKIGLRAKGLLTPLVGSNHFARIWDSLWQAKCTIIGKLRFMKLKPWFDYKSRVVNHYPRFIDGYPWFKSYYLWFTKTFLNLGCNFKTMVYRNLHAKCTINL